MQCVCDRPDMCRCKWCCLLIVRDDRHSEYNKYCWLLLILCELFYILLSVILLERFITEYSAWISCIVSTVWVWNSRHWHIGEQLSTSHLLSLATYLQLVQKQSDRQTDRHTAEKSYIFCCIVCDDIILNAVYCGKYFTIITVLFFSMPNTSQTSPARLQKNAVVAPNGGAERYAWCSKVRPFYCKVSLQS